MALSAKYAGANSGRGVSPGIWSDCPWLEILNDNNIGFGIHDEFLNVGATTAPYQYVGDASPAFLGLDTDDYNGGVIRAPITNTDNNEAYMASGNDTGVLGAIDTLANAGRKTWFEARIRSSYITDMGLYLGLAEAGFVAANALVDNTGDLADGSIIGFHRPAGASELLDFVYGTNGTAHTIGKADIWTPAADTWVKLGLKYDPKIGIYAYVNGVLVTPDPILASATNFPDGEGMLFAFGAKTGTATAINLDADWWRFAQLSNPQ